MIPDFQSGHLWASAQYDEDGAAKDEESAEENPEERISRANHFPHNGEHGTCIKEL